MKFALLSDVHFGPAAYHDGKLRKLTHRAGDLTRTFVEHMNRRVRPDLVINLGDVIEDQDHPTDRRNYAEFVNILGSLDSKVLHVAGNHDTINLSAAELRDLWGTGAGELHYAASACGVQFLVLQTHEIKDRAVHLPDEQFAWLERELERAAAPVVILMHHPASEMQLAGNRWFENAPHVCRVAERRRLRKLLEASDKVVAVCNGHVHWNHFDVIAGIPYLTLQSLTENLDDDAPGRPAAAWALCELDAHRFLVTVHGAETARYQVELPRRISAAPNA